MKNKNKNNGKLKRVRKEDTLPGVVDREVGEIEGVA